MDPTVMTPWVNSNILGIVTPDVTAKLTDDYYLNVNHDWLMNAKLRPGYSSETPIFDAMDTVKKRCIDILADNSLSGNDAQRIQDYYEMWLDWDTRNEIGVSPLQPFADKIKEVDTLDDMSEFLLSDECYNYGTTLAQIRLSVNAVDPSLYEVAINSTALSLGDPAEYKEPTENGKRVRKRNDGIYTYMLSRTGYTGDEIEDILSDMYDFEGKIAAYEKTRLEWSDSNAVQESINPVTIGDLKSMSPAYPIVGTMEQIGYNGSKLINLYEPEWLSGLNELYTEDNLPGIRAYVLTHGLARWISDIDEEAFRENQRLANEYSGITESRTDEEIAFDETRKLFPDCFARIYVDKYLNEEIRQEITSLCEDAIDAYKEILDSEEWMSEQTRGEAVKKLDRITIRAVYPDKWADDSMYQVTPKAEGGNHLQAALDYVNAVNEDSGKKINKKRDKRIWEVDVLSTNIFYEESDNSLYVLPGFFCDATYRSDMSPEEKYGALGNVIGHEISHSFDTNGAMYDADQNIRNWWTEADYKAFTERADKVTAYYDKVVAFDDGTPCFGQLIQSEAIADMAGMKCMLTIGGGIEDFDYDKFFRAYAHMVAEADTLAALESLAATDVHPLPYLRANVSFAQYDEFYDTYGIGKGDGMYIAPADRICVW